MLDVNTYSDEYAASIEVKKYISVIGVDGGEFWNSGPLNRLIY